MEVTAEDGTTKTYAEVYVERTAAPPPFWRRRSRTCRRSTTARGGSVRFSEALSADGSGPPRKSFDVRGGRGNNVKRLGVGLWRVRVKPDSWRDATVTLASGRACGDPGAVCTADGRTLSNTAEASVGRPVRTRIEGGKAREGEDAGTEFAVILNRTLSEAVSVDYATARLRGGNRREAASGLYGVGGGLKRGGSGPRRAMTPLKPH